MSGDAKYPRRLFIETVKFQRNGGGNFELGLMVNEGSGPLIDMDGKVVPAPLWHYHPIPIHRLTVTEEE